MLNFTFSNNEKNLCFTVNLKLKWYKSVLQLTLMWNLGLTIFCF
ncbi:hypothetical protein MCETHM1_02533 [Flavobacteriaceae bacterium]